MKMNKKDKGKDELREICKQIVRILYQSMQNQCIKTA